MKRLAGLFFAIAACQSDPAPPSTLLTFDSGPKADTSTTADGSTPNDGSVTDSTAMDASNPIDATPCTSLTNPPADSKCASCLLASCCTVTNTCLGDPDCAALVACIKVCKADGSSSNDKSCIAACFKAHPNSVNAGADYDNCRLMSCAMQCP